MMEDNWREEVEKRRRDLAIAEATKSAAMSGAASGAVLGGAGRLLSGGRSVGAILKAAGLGALGASGLAGGSTYVGSQLLGPRESDEESGYSTRGGIGGAIGGGLLGAGAGALLGGGKLSWMKRMPFAEKLAARANANLPLDNLLVDRLKSWASSPGMASAKKSAALLGGIGGSLGGASGFDEGMQLDYLKNLQEHEKQKKLEEALSAY